jgi:two-component system, autoinducer 2 sensor kinase/phosphatase LuxQ
MNLLTNANKFTRSGVIKIVCKYKVEYEQLFIIVVDEGIGIKEEDVKLLFKPFAKLKSGESFNPNGIGLGLSICKGILDKIGCDICVVSSTV